MSSLELLHSGFSVILTWAHLFYLFLGVLIGTLIGVLPGIGPAATISLLLPSTVYIDTTGALIMLSGVFYGAMYGGSTTSILVNIPGETASIVTCFDGYQMARQGRAGPALGIAAFGSFMAGTVSIVGLMLLAPILAKFALIFGPAEYFSLIFMCFSTITYMTAGSILKSLIMGVTGIFLGAVGTDAITGVQRFTYGSLTLMDGIGFVPVLMGTFGIAEVLESLEEEIKRATLKAPKLRHLLPNLKDWKDSTMPMLRGGLLGFFLGLFPGGNPAMSSFLSYALEKRLSKHPERFGKGAIEGVAGPESANNAAVAANFVPLLTFGIPTNSVLALILGALMMHGVTPGPTLITDNPQIFWGIIASMYAGNVMLLVLNLPLIGIWVRLLRIPYSFLGPLILLFCLIGVYSLNSDTWELIIAIIFGFFGYLARKFKYPAAPLAFALILSPILEKALRQSLLISGGSISIFFNRPIACTFMIIGIILMLLQTIPSKLFIHKPHLDNEF